MYPDKEPCVIQACEIFKNLLKDHKHIIIIVPNAPRIIIRNFYNRKNNQNKSTLVLNICDKENKK